MTATVVEAAECYFTPAEPYFWHWAGRGCAEIEGGWPSIGLIGFRDEVVLLLSALQPHGWPPLSAVLLIMAASRESWPLLRQNFIPIFDKSSPNNPFVKDVIEQLDRLHALPADLRTSTAAKIRLAEVIFEGSRPVMEADAAKEALAFLQSVAPMRDPASWSSRHYPSVAPIRFADWTRSLRIGLARLNEETLRNRQQTGLDLGVLAAPIPESPALTISERATTHAERLWEWSHDPQLFGVARIARQLMAVVTWPRQLSQPNDLPLGGVSDLTNRGPLDRLLLTELAQDDDALMVRIALNEALYLRRECPRQDSAHSRTILVDAGLRMWGRPRVFGAAVALAMAAAQDRDENLVVDVAVTTREGWQSEDITTRAGAIELLGTLSPTLHPGEILEEWRSAQETEQALEREFVIVTTPDVVRQPAFQQQLSKLPVDFRLALVDGQGRFELRSHSAHGWRTDFAAELDLDELLQPPAAPTPSLPLHTSTPDRYPAIMRTEAFPLLLTHQLEPQHCFPVGADKMVTLASAGRVLLWSGSQKGARQLAVDVPRGRVECWATFTTAEYRHAPRTFAVLRAKRWGLLAIDAVANTCQTVELQTDLSPGDPTVRAIILPECVVLISKRNITAFGFSNGEVLVDEHRQESVLVCQGNRYVSDPSGLRWRMAFDGKLHFESMQASPTAVFLIDPIGITDQTGPVEVHAKLPAKQDGMAIPGDCEKIESIEQWGSFVVLLGQFHSRQHCAVLNLYTSHWSRRLGITKDLMLLEVISSPFRTRPALRTKFAGIVCVYDMVCLVSAKQQWWRISLVNGHLMLMPQETLLQPMPPNSPPESWPAIPFERLRWPGSSIVMHTAKFENGNTVWLDSRGLLHLLPADAKQPEVTLVLDAKAMSGWVSDGRQFGDSYYLTSPGKGCDPVPTGFIWQTQIAPFFGIHP